MSDLKRRGLSGIMFFETFPGETKRKPTCFEDCSIERQNEILDGLHPDAVKDLARKLANVITTMADEIGITIKEEE